MKNDGRSVSRKIVCYMLTLARSECKRSKIAVFKSELLPPFLYIRQSEYVKTKKNHKTKLNIMRVGNVEVCVIIFI